MIVACASGASSPSLALATVTPTPSGAASPAMSESDASSTAIPALTQTFTSPTMEFSVMYPAGWTVTPATKPWLPGGSNFWDDPVGDRLEGDGAGFRGTSQGLQV